MTTRKEKVAAVEETSIGKPVDVKAGETVEIGTLVGDAAPGAEATAAASDLDATGNPVDTEDDPTTSEDVDRRAALASLATASPDGVAVPTIEVEAPAVYTSGKEYDWSGDTDESTSTTVIITGTLVTLGARLGQRGDKVKLGKSAADKLIRLGTAVKA